MRKGIIFDLDLTLVDTTKVESARHERNWQLAYSLIPECYVYDGLDEVFGIIRRFNIQTCIVSTSPKPYIEKIVKHFQLPIKYIIGYHDAKPIKPHPAPMVKALELLELPNEECISFGDRAIDIESSNAANIESVACFWGTKEKKLLLNSNYKHAIIKPNEIITLIR